jgi:RimJ/RimL family protein N-acetyltransferase
MFEEVDIKLIRTTSAINNRNSWKLMEKLGFQRMNQTKFMKYTLINKNVEAYQYELNKEDFTKNVLKKIKKANSN